MTVTLVDCAQCEGKGIIPHPNPGEVPCSTCHGFKVVNAQRRGYANARTAQRGIDTRKAHRCYTCRGKGTRVNPDTERCWSCHGGKLVASFAPGDVIPDGITLTDHPTREALSAYADEVRIVIRRHADKTLSVGAALLGLGTVYTAQDYGRAFEAGDDVALTAKVRESLRQHHQLCKFVDDGTRTVAETVAVDVTPGGYTVTTEASRLGAQRAMLPPTYTPEVLNAPAN